MVQSAMWVFWENGFEGTSVEDLVSATGVGRGAIYSDFGGKEELFFACLTEYLETFMAAAIETLRSDAEGLDAISDYFDYFIGLHKKRGMPGPGCFIANTMTELAPHLVEAREKIEEHMEMLRRSFLRSIKQAAKKQNSKKGDKELNELARLTVISTQGLWSYARGTSDLTALESFKRSFLTMLEATLGR